MKKRKILSFVSLLISLLVFAPSPRAAADPSVCNINRNGVSITVHYYGGCGTTTHWIASVTSQGRTDYYGGTMHDLGNDFPSCCPL